MDTTSVPLFEVFEMYAIYRIFFGIGTGEVMLHAHLTSPT